jgi:hypothetical protein
MAVYLLSREQSLLLQVNDLMLQQTNLAESLLGQDHLDVAAPKVNGNQPPDYQGPKVV